MALRYFLSNGAEKRRDIWPNRAEALRALQSGSSFKAWDPRLLQIFVEHGMRELPTATYPDQIQGVILKCPKRHEAASYRDSLGLARAAKYFRILCELIPVHIIYGEIHDQIPASVKDDVLSIGTGGRHASHFKVPDAGHLIVQTQPKGLAVAIMAALQAPPNRTPLDDFVRSRL